MESKGALVFDVKFIAWTSDFGEITWSHN